MEDPEDWEQLDSEDGQNQEGASLQPDSQAGPSAPRRSRDSARVVAQAALPAPTSAPAAIQQEQQQQQQQQQEDVVMVDPPLQISRSVLADIDTAFLNIDENHPMFSGTGTGTVGSASNNPSSIIVPVVSSLGSLPGPASSSPMPIPSPGSRSGDINSRGASGRDARTPSPTGAPVSNGQEGPITPRNDAGPWVFDGNDIRLSGDGFGIDPNGCREAAAAQQGTGQASSSQA